MKRDQLIRRLVECEKVILRSGVTDYRETMAELESLDGPGISRHTKWMKAVEAACVQEADHYKDQTPKAWENLKLLNPGSGDLKRLKKLQADVKRAWNNRG